MTRTCCLPSGDVTLSLSARPSYQRVFRMTRTCCLPSGDVTLSLSARPSYQFRMTRTWCFPSGNVTLSSARPSPRAMLHYHCRLVRPIREDDTYLVFPLGQCYTITVLVVSPRAMLHYHCRLVRPIRIVRPITYLVSPLGRCYTITVGSSVLSESV